MSEMKEDSLGDFVTFGDEDEKVLTIMGKPIKRTSRFTNPDGSEKPEYVFDVMVEGSTRPQKWSVSAKQVMQQVLAIMTANNLKSLDKERLRVTTSGSGKDRRYIVRRVTPPQKGLI